MLEICDQAMHIHGNRTFPVLDWLFPEQLQLLTITDARISPCDLNSLLQLSELQLERIGSSWQLYVHLAALTNLRRLHLEDADFGVCISTKGEDNVLSEKLNALDAAHDSW